MSNLQVPTTPDAQVITVDVSESIDFLPRKSDYNNGNTEHTITVLL